MTTWNPPKRLRQHRANKPLLYFPVFKNVSRASQCHHQVKKAWKILSSVTWKSALVYSDDIVGFSKTVKVHMLHQWKVLILRKDSSVALEFKMCSFLAGRIDYLGNVNCPSECKTADTAILSIKEVRDSTSRTELRSFFGLFNAFCCFFPSFSRVALPLYKKLRKDEQTQFQTLAAAKKSTVEQITLLLASPLVLTITRRVDI